MDKEPINMGETFQSFGLRANIIQPLTLYSVKLSHQSLSLFLSLKLISSWLKLLELGKTFHSDCILPELPYGTVHNGNLFFPYSSCTLNVWGISLKTGDGDNSPNKIRKAMKDILLFTETLAFKEFYAKYLH